VFSLVSVGSVIFIQGEWHENSCSSSGGCIDKAASSSDLAMSSESVPVQQEKRSFGS
jgi:hypothetical protein